MDSFCYTGFDQTKTKKFKKFELKNKFAMSDQSRVSNDQKSNKGMPCSEFANRFQEVVLGGLEKLFYKYGKFVAR